MIVPLSIGSGKRNVGVLSPKEFALIFDHLNTEYKIRVNFLLHTHMRIEEARYVTSHPDCYRKDHGTIFLPKVEGLGKKRCTIANRPVILSTPGLEAVDKYFESKVGLSTYQAMEGVLKRAARDADFDSRYFTTKMLRKTMVSWLMACFPERQMQIAVSAGHNYATMRGHYLTYGWRKEDVADMRVYVNSWGEA
jgi:integrase